MMANTMTETTIVSRAPTTAPNVQILSVFVQNVLMTPSTQQLSSKMANVSAIMDTSLAILERVKFQLAVVQVSTTTGVTIAWIAMRNVPRAMIGLVIATNANRPLISI
jgi:hypothetical protein